MQAFRSLPALLLLAALAVTGSFKTGRAQTAVQLKPGDEAPQFSLKATDDRTYRLTDFLGKKAVVLAWFVKAFIPA